MSKCQCRGTTNYHCPIHGGCWGCTHEKKCDVTSEGKATDEGKAYGALCALIVETLPALTWRDVYKLADAIGASGYRKGRK